MGSQVVVSGVPRPQVTLGLDERTGKWRTKVTWVLPDSAPITPATLDGVSGLAALPTTDAEMHRVLSPMKPVQLGLRLDGVPTPPPVAAALPTPKPTPKPTPASKPVTVVATLKPVAAPSPSSEDSSSSSASSSSALSAPVEKETTLVVTVSGEEGEPPGINIDEHFMVTKIIPGSVMEGKVQLGDVIKTLNKFGLATRGDFLQRWNRAMPNATVEVGRSAARGRTLLASMLPEEVEKLLVRKADFDYLIKPVDVNKSGKALGLGLETLVNKVVVVRVAENSAGAEVFKQWDTISAVDRLRVSDALVAKHLIRDRSGKFEALIERPSDGKTREGIVKGLEKALQAKRSLNMANESDDWAAFQGPADVAAIVADAIPKRRGSTAARPILSLTPIPKNSARRPVTVNVDPATVVPIQSDIDPNKPLRKVPKL